MPEGYLALDIGASKSAWCYEEGEIHEEGVESTVSFNPNALLFSLKARGYKVCRIGVSFAGQVSGGEVHSSPGIDIVHFNWSMLRAEGYTVSIDNDLKCAVLAEAALLGVDNISALYLGTGLGSASICEGKLVRGASNIAGEIGHLSYRHTPFTCGCGKNDCLELWASGGALRRWADHLGFPVSTYAELVQIDDTQIRQVLTHFEERLAYACSILLLMHNPSVLVLGGGVVSHSPELLERIRALLPLFVPRFALDQVKLVCSTIPNAALKGAMMLAKTTKEC